MDKLISVIVPHNPSRKRKHLLLKCLKSLTTQSLDLKYYEIVVVIDGIDEKIKKSIKKLDNTIIVVMKRHTGVCQTRNLGIEKSNGKFIAFIDDDCVADLNWLENYLEFVRRNSSCQAIGGTILSSNNISVFQRYADYRGLLRKPIFINNQIVSLITANAFIRRDILIDIDCFDKYFDKITDSCGGEDADISYKILKRGFRLLFCPKALVYHYHRKSAIDFFIQQFRNGKGLAIHCAHRNTSLENIGFPEPKLSKIINHFVKYLYRSNENSPSLLNRVKIYWLNKNIEWKDKFIFPVIDITRRISYYIGIYLGNKFYLRNDTANL